MKKEKMISSKEKKKKIEAARRKFCQDYLPPLRRVILVRSLGSGSNNLKSRGPERGQLLTVCLKSISLVDF